MRTAGLTQQWLIGFAICLLATALPAGEAQTDARGMMRRYLLGEVERAAEKRNAACEARTTPQQIADYQRRGREWFLQAIGGLPQRTPLHARVTEHVEKPGYRVEKLIYESQPGFFVTAALFLPDHKKFPPPHPAVLVPCGHAEAGKAEEAYQRACALLALHGIAALIFDPVDQGERIQMIDAQGKPTWRSGVYGHTRAGLGAILLGQSIARQMIWDGMRGLDYLESRAEIDATRLGCMGNSGGGTQTAYLTALDDRITVASPSCYITSFERLLNTIGPQDAEQNIFGQVAFGLDHGDYLMLRAPVPALICAATRDFFDIAGTWQSFRQAKRLYTRLGFAERVDLVESDDTHGYKQPLRQAAVRWMVRWLRGVDEPIVEPPDMQVLTAEEIRATPGGQAMLLPGARSIYDLHDEYEVLLAQRRAAVWSGPDQESALREVRQLAGIRRLHEIAKGEVDASPSVTEAQCIIESLVIRPEAGIELPAKLYRPASGSTGRPLLAVHEAGTAALDEHRQVWMAMARGGQPVLLLELRGTGSTAPKTADFYAREFGADGRDILTAYLLGRSYIGMRAEDLLIGARWLDQRFRGEEGGVDLLAVGHACQPALHAAVLEPELFGKVRLIGALESWSGVVRDRLFEGQLVNLVHGALTAYDLPDLRRQLGARLTVSNELPLRLTVE